MSILDDAIREHLELKRAHGADDSELKRLEDEAFGPPQRPDEIDPFAEAPTEFLTSPSETPADAPAVGDEHERSGRRPNLTDLQEGPPSEPPPPPPGGPAADLAPPTDEGPTAPSDEGPAAPTDEASPAPVDEAAPPAEEEQPAGEHEIVPDAGPSTEERRAIADQPTQMFDVQAQMDAEAAEAPAGEQASPSDDELLDAAAEQPQAAPPAPEETAPPSELFEQPPLESRGPDAEIAGHPPAEAAPEEESAEFDFFNEQRLSDELDQALEAPLPPTDEHVAMPQYEDASAEGGIFDFETTEREPYEDDPSQEVLRRHDEGEAPAAEEPPSEEAPRRAPEPPSEESPRDSAEPPAEEDDYDFDPETGHEDVLEDTPRFLEDAPEDDDLWFEQKPPKDFDLD
jgi:hypothetical protein